MSPWLLLLFCSSFSFELLVTIFLPAWFDSIIWRMRFGPQVAAFLLVIEVFFDSCLSLTTIGGLSLSLGCLELEFGIVFRDIWDFSAGISEDLEGLMNSMVLFLTVQNVPAYFYFAQDKHPLSLRFDFFNVNWSVFISGAKTSLCAWDLLHLVEVVPIKPSCAVANNPEQYFFAKVEVGIRTRR